MCGNSRLGLFLTPGRAPRKSGGGSEEPPGSSPARNKHAIPKRLAILPTSRRANFTESQNFTTPPQLFNSARRRADAACNSSSHGPFRAPIGSLESTRSRAARRRGPFLRTPLSSRVGTGPPVLSFSSAVFVCGIPRSECVICRFPLFHRHDHTPHHDSAIRQPALFLPQVAGAHQKQIPRST